MSNLRPPDASTVAAHNRLKPLAELWTVDPRVRSTTATFDLTTGAMRDITIEEHHAQAASLTLRPEVPEDIAVSFETAKNLYLYSFYAYRFGVVAAAHAIQTLEFALRSRLKAEGVVLKPMRLSKYLEHAVQLGWVCDSDLSAASRQGATGGNRYVALLAKDLPRLRNELAHGSFALFPQAAAFEQLTHCADMINAISRSDRWA